MGQEFTVGGFTYRAGRLSAKQQFHVSRRMVPVVSSIGSLGAALAAFRSAKALAEPGDTGMTLDRLSGLAPTLEMLRPVMDAIAALPDRDCDFVLDTCMGVVERRIEGGIGWAKVWSPGGMMFEDIDMIGMIRIAAEVLKDNLAGFFPGRPSTSNDLAGTAQGSTG